MQKRKWNVLPGRIDRNLILPGDTHNVGELRPKGLVHNQAKPGLRFALGVLYVFMFLAGVLCVHIYIVTRHKAPDANTRIMARLDIQQPIDDEDAGKITAWLYSQKGVDHVLVNPQSKIAVFTFAPVRNSADQIVSAFRASLPYKAIRYLPAAADLKGSCPAGF